MRLLFLCALPLTGVAAESGSIATFQYAVGGHSYTVVGRDPALRGTTKIPTVVVPVSLSFEGKSVRMDATSDVSQLLHSPVFLPVAFPVAETTQFADGMLRATFAHGDEWHTLLGQPEVMSTVNITVPSGAGYVLTSKKSGSSLGIVDIEFVQRELFKQLPQPPGKLVIAVTHNTAYYTEGDATLCCSYGTHGLDSASRNSFVLASYLRSAPDLATEQDVQPLTEQLGELINDPLHDPLVHQESGVMPGNRFPPWIRPAWMRPGDQGRCGGTGAASAYFLLEPTDTNRKNNLPESKPFVARARDAVYHLQNVALLPWYVGAGAGLGNVNSFPEPQALMDRAKPCMVESEAAGRMVSAAPPPEEQPGNALPRRSARSTELLSCIDQAQLGCRAGKSANGHQLIGYWTGHVPLREVSSQWDVIIVAFATPDRNAAEGTLQFQPLAGMDRKQFQADVAFVKSRGKKVMVSLGGGGQYFTFADAKSIPNFVSGVTRIVSEYAFDGIDIDFESPSLTIDAGDHDFRHPTTPSIVNLIAALRQLREHFGPKFMISLVPEGTQIPAGYATYGGQFGSYLPLAYGIRDILSFLDVQDYNTPPMEGLDGEIYQAGSVDYHAAVTELLLHGFAVAGDPKQWFPALPANKIAVGFLTGDADPSIVTAAMDYLIAGKSPRGAQYMLRRRRGYPRMLGAMFWTIDDDRLENFRFSNLVGPALHGYAAATVR